MSPDWQRAIGIRLFYAGGQNADPGALPALADVEDPAALPGFVFQAGRALRGLSQQELRDRSLVSKKVINDFENDFIRPSAHLVAKLAETLTALGVRFVRGDGVVGVVVVMSRTGADQVSRSPKRRHV